MKIRVLLFARLAELAGCRELCLELPNGAVAGSVLGEACRVHSALNGATGSVGVAVNRRLVTPETPLQDGDEVALIPPVSGG